MKSALFLRGTFNQWQTSSFYQFTGNDAQLRLVVHLPEGHQEFKVATADWVENYGTSSDAPLMQEKEIWQLCSEGGNLKFDVQSQNYEFFFHLHEKSLEIRQCNFAPDQRLEQCFEQIRANWHSYSTSQKHQIKDLIKKEISHLSQ
ncbi:MAG: hypothetical protein HQM14_00440 [SAR324 cluster bacterium]|nr:hypothetical protein [SAR324 cluster bacterium]